MNKLNKTGIIFGFANISLFAIVNIQYFLDSRQAFEGITKVMTCINFPATMIYGCIWWFSPLLVPYSWYKSKIYAFIIPAYMYGIFATLYWYYIGVLLQIFIEGIKRRITKRA
jgi:hypothetical protein